MSWPMICWQHKQGQPRADQAQTLSRASNNSNISHQLYAGPKQPHLSNPVRFWAVVAWQPIEKFKTPDNQAAAGCSSFKVQQPVEWSGITCPISCRKTGNTGVNSAGGSSIPLHTYTSMKPCLTSDVKVILLNDHHVPEVGVVPKGKDHLAVGPWIAPHLRLLGQEWG